MMKLISFLLHRRGTTGAEFALVLPVAVAFLLGIIDVGNYAYTLNKYEKATQMGARFAVVTDVVAEGLLEEEYIGSTSCNGGVALAASQTICKEALSKITCGSSGTCTCSGNCPTKLDRDDAAFDAIVARMQAMAPLITEGQVKVSYEGSGLGYAGDPVKPEIAPITTITVENATYSPIVLSPLGGTVPLPDFRYSLTLEDGEGAESN